MKETIPTTEKRQELRAGDVLEFISKHGRENPEFGVLLGRYFEQEEQRVARFPDASMKFNLQRADLYRQAGTIDPTFFDAALENLEDARVQAAQEDRSEWLTRIEREIDRLVALMKVVSERKN